MQFLSRFHFHDYKDSPVKFRKVDAKFIKISTVAAATFSFLNLELAIVIISKGIKEDAREWLV